MPRRITCYVILDRILHFLLTVYEILTHYRVLCLIIVLTEDYRVNFLKL